MFIMKAMKIKLITVGAPKLSFAKSGIAEYSKRLSRFAQVEILHIKENKHTDKKIMTAIGPDVCLLMDEKGDHFSSLELSRLFGEYKNQSQSISIVIGGPDGHSLETRRRANKFLALSRLTFPHDIAMMLTLETLYRSLTILSGHPYHRE